MPFAARTIEVETTLPDVTLSTIAAEVIGVTLTARGWSLASVVPVVDTATVAVTYQRTGERDRDFEATTAKQWPDIKRRLLQKLGKPTESTVVVDSCICSDCGVDNSATIGNCIGCGKPRVVVNKDSQLRKLIADVKIAVAALETFLENQ